MKLHAHHIAAFDGRCERLNVVCACRGVCRYGRLIGMRKVDEVAFVDATEQV